MVGRQAIAVQARLQKGGLTIDNLKTGQQTQPQRG
jgi:hypothetical protein